MNHTHTYLENRIKYANERIDFLTEKSDREYNSLTKAFSQIRQLEATLEKIERRLK